MGQDVTKNTMFSPGNKPCVLPDGPPLFQIVVDTEEEFDWGAPFDRGSVAVSAITAQHHAQEIFARFGLVPTYVIDYPVATNATAIATLRAFHDAGGCLIGTHLHPWVNPPHDEPVNARNSYPGNLDAGLERRKIEVLTAAIASAFGSRPVIYKAGRYGVGPATAQILHDLGYQIDLSVVPHTDFGADHGPNFHGCPDRPYWFGPDYRMLEIPLSRGFSGVAAPFGPRVYERLTNGAASALRAGAILSRARLLERATLTPEGADTAAHKRLARALLRQGHRVFTLTYHSPSLAPGHTPYVRTAADLEQFLRTIEATLRFFMIELGALPTTPLEVRRMALAR
jgi:peptidoglycan/xylan/chitin deacetylase (PgdA/CDA1 family)